MTETSLDTTGLRCPLPVLRARKAMKSVEPGGILQVTATDPDSQQDFRAFCETTGYELLESRAEGGIFTFRIRKT